LPLKFSSKTGRVHSCPDVSENKNLGTGHGN
jgi:hypothetical protein